MNIIIVGLAAAAAVAIIVAFYKHKTLAAVEASAKKEIVNIEAFAAKVEAAAKADFSAAVAKLKAIF